jgi:aspartokinase
VFLLNRKAVTSLSVTDEVTLITIDNIPNNTKTISDIFNAIADEGINIDMISQTIPYRGILNLSFTVSDRDLPRALQVLGTFKKTIPELRTEVNSNNCKLSVYGEAMKELSGVAAKFFTIFSENDIEIKLITTSEVDISCLIDAKDIEKAEAAIKSKFNI